MKTNFKALGHKVTITPTGQEDSSITNDSEKGDYVSPINQQFVMELNETLKKYADGKKNLELKIVENERWYRINHWDLFRGKNKDNNDPEPTTAYLFSTLADKHADAMDYYPNPNFLERHPGDKDESEKLTNIVPLIMDQNNFRKTWSAAWWYKLKQGTSAYGVFWNDELDNGLGNVDIKKLDLLNLYWESGISDVQDSRKFFIITLMDDDVMHEMYPRTKEKMTAIKTIDIKAYVNDDTIDLSKKSVIVDAYYKKKNKNGDNVVHMTKFVGNEPLESTEDDPETAESGLYSHGLYPIIFDVLFPEENTPIGFGYIDIIKNPQMYIDKLDQIISKNALVAGKIRTIIKENGAINEEELSDLSIDIVHSSGDVQEGRDFATIQGKPLPGFIINHRTNKIEELKETAGSNNFSRGTAGQGITAASAIMALQEAGNKTSRDMIDDSYGTYSQMIYMVISLMAQFYDVSRMFRITDDGGNKSFVQYSNQGLKPQQLPPAFPGEGMMPQMDESGQAMMDPSGQAMMSENPDFKAKMRKPIFDIKVVPEKASPYSRAAQNELSKEMFAAGFFNPQMADGAIIAIGMMSFEGKDKVLQQVTKNSQLAQQIAAVQQQAQQMLQQNAQLQQQIAALTSSNQSHQDVISGLNHMLKTKTGIDMMSPNAANVQTVPADQGGM